MNSNELMHLMKDENMVERYSNHLIAILFEYQDAFIKPKYEAYVAATKPKADVNFFERMVQDKVDRDERERERAKRNERTKILGQDGEESPSRMCGLKAIGFKLEVVDYES